MLRVQLSAKRRRQTFLKLKIRCSRSTSDQFVSTVNVNPNGGDCPIALRMISVYVLLEITSFLRETYLILPKSGRLSVRERPGNWHGAGGLGVNMRDHHPRRWSTTLPAMGPTHASAQSLHSVGDGQGYGGYAGTWGGVGGEIPTPQPRRQARVFVGLAQASSSS